VGVVGAVEIYARPIGQLSIRCRLLRVSAKSGESWRLAGAMTISRGMPQASTTIERLMARFPRSTGLLPAISPPQGALVMQQSTARVTP
jgi:hypothetical protein